MADDDSPALQLPGDFWKKKIAALLYRCPDAALYDEAALETRRQQLYDQIKKETGLDLPGYLNDAKRADQLAWAADRPPLAGVPNRFPSDCRVVHPFSSEPSAPLWSDDISSQTIADAVDACVVELLKGNLSGSSDDGRKAFFALWRRLEDRLADTVKAIGHNWRLMPADGRLSDGIWSHTGTASAIAGTGNQPAFLIFTLAGTQDFISQARRSQDFWAGSFVIAWLSGAAMRWAAENLGPDTVVLPTLRRQPLVDHWLTEDMGIEGLPESSPAQRTVANLPNIFTLIVPWEQAHTVGTRLEDAVRQERNTLFEEVQNLLMKRGFPTGDRYWQQVWEEQRAEFLEVDLFWAAAPWSDDPVQVLNELKQEQARANQGGSIAGGDPVDALIAAIESIELTESPGAAYAIESGLTSHVLTTRKNTRAFPARLARTNLGACTLCGQRPALHMCGHTTVKDLRDFWDKQHEASPATVRSGERLCAVCLVKRLAFESYFEAKLGVSEFRFPSTSSIATASFKDAVIKRSAEDGVGQPSALEKPLREFVKELQGVFTDQKIRWTIRSSRMSRRLEQLAHEPSTGGIQDQELIKDFLRIDGEWLYEDSYQEESIKHEYGVGIPDAKLGKVREKLKTLITEADKLGIRPPAKYYAIIVADGDKAGDWIGGLRNPTYQRALNPGVDFTGISRLDWLDKRRPSGPASQGALAAALSDFALHRVPCLVEEQYGGKLIYAGGDDVVAMVPLWNHTRDEHANEPRHVLGLVDRLAQAFRDDFHDVGSFGLGGHDLEPEMPGKPAASLSVNVTILHHSEQLALHISGGSAGLKSYVKKTLDRNALGIDAVKRSGAGLRAGVKWAVDDKKPVNVLAQLMDHLSVDNGRGLSPRLAHELATLSPSLKSFFTGDAALRKMAEAEIRRLAGRHTNGTDKQNQAVINDLKELTDALVAMSTALGAVHSDGEPSLEPWEMLVEFLEIAQFVQREA